MLCVCAGTLPSDGEAATRTGTELLAREVRGHECSERARATEWHDVLRMRRASPRPPPPPAARRGPPPLTGHRCKFSATERGFPHLRPLQIEL